MTTQQPATAPGAPVGPLRPTGVRPRALAEVCAGIDGVRVDPCSESVLVTGISLDSRTVARGEVYVALRGQRAHGADFAADAARRGAVAALTDAEGAERCRSAGLAVVVADDPRPAMALVSARIFPQQLPVVGITGTNGKTTTSFLVEAGLRAAGRRVGTIGTNGFRLDARPLESDARTTVTTPESPDLMALLAVMAERGADVVVMEVSSHALALHRVDGVRFCVGGFLNLGRDHLDFHPTMHDYFEAKARLFEPGRCEVAVVNLDPPASEGEPEWGAELAARIRGQHAARLVTVTGPSAPASGPGRGVPAGGDTPPGDYAVQSWTPTGAGSDVVARTPEEQVRFSLLLPGAYNVANALAALAICDALGVPQPDVLRGLGEAVVPGRMQPVPLDGPAPRVFVDFAHTPQAISAALAALPPGSPRVAVLGAGGDRDRDKREPMGRAAAQGADVVVVTDDNPRSEDPGAIRSQVADGARRTRDDVRVFDVTPRDAAILRALQVAGADGVVAVLGKGHEQGQLVGSHVLPFDDVSAVTAGWAALGGGQ